MRYVEEFRDPKAAKGVLAAIARVADETGATRDAPVRIMEICGGHTHAIFRYGLDKLVHEVGLKTERLYFAWGATASTLRRSIGVSTSE